MIDVPESIAAAARARAAETQDQRIAVEDAVRSGQQVRADPDFDRTTRRITAITGANPDQAVKVARNEDPAEIGLTGMALLGAEKIQGTTTDFQPMCFVEEARAAGNAVGRIVFTDLQPQGTGFLISDCLLITNNHVIPTETAAGGFEVQFGYELDCAGAPRQATRFEFDPDRFFLTSSLNDLDYTVVAVGKRVDGSAELSTFPCCPLSNAGDKHMLGEFVNVIQHPNGDYKQIVIRENRLVGRLDRVLHYEADTLGGASGSPVFNDQWQVVALHHYGGSSPIAHLPDNQVRDDVNEGVRISAIYQSLADAMSGLSPEKQALLSRALQPSGSSEKRKEERIMPTEKITTTFTVPIKITVEVPGGKAETTPVELQPCVWTDASTQAEAVHVDQDYSNRGGYDKDFLPDCSLPMPGLDEQQMNDAAKNLQPQQGDDPYELKYEHFSIVMNAKRRMAYFTAANIDGATWKHVVRKTGEVQPEAYDKWWIDPRIGADQQCGEEFYRSKMRFDHGHLCRREDPAWGSDPDAVKANADTFHYTNCTPQASLFNQGKTVWQGIENYILDRAKDQRLKMTVITGPVFSEKDPIWSGSVRVPLQFWKVVAWMDGGALRSCALVADQSGYMAEAAQFDVTEYQCSVQHIADLTGLDFGRMTGADTFKQSPESLLPMRQIWTPEAMDLGPKPAPVRP